MPEVQIDEAREIGGSDAEPWVRRASTGTVVHEDVGPLHLRNVATFAAGEVDRSPTGSATSARTTLLLDDGVLSVGQTWRNDSIIGTTFHARAIGTADEGVLTEVEGIGVPNRRACRPDRAFFSGHSRAPGLGDRHG